MVQTSLYVARNMRGCQVIGPAQNLALLIGHGGESLDQALHILVLPLGHQVRMPRDLRGDPRHGLLATKGLKGHLDLESPVVLGAGHFATSLLCAGALVYQAGCPWEFQDARSTYQGAPVFALNSDTPTAGEKRVS